MNFVNFNTIIMVAMLLLWFKPALAGDDVESSISELQHGWARVLYQTPTNQKEATYQELAAQAHQVTLRFPGRAEPVVWEAIVLSSYADFQNGLGSLGKLKSAKALLLSAGQMNSGSMDGIIPTVLGVLYYKAPGWPLSFGDERKARECLEAALKINPDGIDANFYYGDFLMRQREYAKARVYLAKALAAPPRPGREDADSGRKAEIRHMLHQISLQTENP